MCSGIPTFFQPIASLLEGLEPSSTVVNLRHLTIYKPSIYMYHLLAIWEFGLTKSYFRNFIMYFYSFIRCICTYLIRLLCWICKNKKNAFFPVSVSSHLLFYGEEESDPSIFLEHKGILIAFRDRKQHPVLPFEINKFSSKITKGYSCVQCDPYSSCKTSVWK